MLAVQTADEILYVPEWDIASITPTYPDRSRIVLADGRVGHRPGQGTGEVWLNPNLVTREGDSWKDPAGYLFPYQPLAEMAEPDEYDPLLTIKRQNRVWFLRTDTEETPSDLKSDQIAELYPQLRQVSKDLFVNTLRIRRMGSREKGGWVELDTGERILVLATLYHPLANFLGCDSFDCMDDSVPYRIWKLRDLPYDLTSAEPERIKKDCPDAASFCRQLLWQVVVEHERGIIRDYGTDHESFARHPLASAGQRCGFQLGPTDLAEAVRALLWDDQVILLHQLGYRETDPDKRLVGDRLPHILLIAPQEQQTESRQAALDLGISLLVLHYNPQLALEYLARELTSPLQLIILAPAKLGRIALRLAQLCLSTMGTPLTIPDLSELPKLVAGLPQPWTTDQTEPFRRVALEAPEGLVFVPPLEIACWSPTLPSRWRVVLASGRVLHHPGPVPPGP